MRTRTRVAGKGSEVVVLELLLAVASLAVGACVLNVLGDWMSGRERATLEWGSILVITLVGSGLFLLWEWSGVAGVLAVIAGWSVIGILWDKICGRQPDGPQSRQ